MDAGVLAKQPYKSPGQRTRYEYVLTGRGRQLFPVLVSLVEFGMLLQGDAKRLDLVHGDGCGAPLVTYVSAPKATACSSPSRGAHPPQTKALSASEMQRSTAPVGLNKPYGRCMGRLRGWSAPGHGHADERGGHAGRPAWVNSPV